MHDSAARSRRTSNSVPRTRSYATSSRSPTARSENSSSQAATGARDERVARSRRRAGAARSRRRVRAPHRAALRSAPDGTAARSSWSLSGARAAAARTTRSRPTVTTPTSSSCWSARQPPDAKAVLGPRPPTARRRRSAFSGCLAGGLSSGEGLIAQVRDHADEDGSQAPADKRRLVVEPEFAQMLKVLAREGNTLSAIVRQAWDGEPLQTIVRNDPLRATGANMAIVGHITRDELLRYLTATELANGFANRFLLIAVQRSKLLPFGGALDERRARRDPRRHAPGAALRHPAPRRSASTTPPGSAGSMIYSELSPTGPAWPAPPPPAPRRTPSAWR